MGTVASQITSLTIVYSNVYRTQIKENIKAPRHWPVCGEFTGTGEFPAQRASNAEMFPFDDVIMIKRIAIQLQFRGRWPISSITFSSYTETPTVNYLFFFLFYYRGNMSFQTYKSPYLWFALSPIIITVNHNSKDNVPYICVCVCTFEVNAQYLCNIAFRSVIPKSCRL